MRASYILRMATIIRALATYVSDHPDPSNIKVTGTVYLHNLQQGTASLKSDPPFIGNM